MFKMIEYTVKVYDGYKEWWFNGKTHREDGPAVEFSNGSKEWYLNGKRHREDGPAVEHSNGSKVWWVDGIKMSEEEFKKKTNHSKRYDSKGSD